MNAFQWMIFREEKKNIYGIVQQRCLLGLIGHYSAHVHMVTFSMVPVIGAMAPAWIPSELTEDKYLGTGMSNWTVPSYK